MRPTPPRYGHSDVSVLIPDAVRTLSGNEPELLDLPPAVAGVVVLVVDGLGQHLLDAHAALAPFLSSSAGDTVDAPFPTTTTTSLTSIGTGLAPGQHGIVGYSLGLPHEDRRLVVLTWSWDRQDHDLDARDDVVPEHLQPAPTAFELAARSGVRAVTVLRPEFVGSGLTRAGLRGGHVVPATGLEETLGCAVGAASTRGPTVVYAYHGDLDTIGHREGPGSDEWCSELADVDRTLARTAAHLPDDVALVVTADHGMITVPPAGFVELADAPELLDGVRVLTGDARARQLHTEAGAAPDVLASWRESFGDLAHVRSRDEAVDAGWFGPVAPHVYPRIGDVVVSARTLDVAWVHRDIDLFGGRLAGMHGALTPEERRVPSVVVTKGDM